MRSPSFRTHRSGRQKRTRSPPSPNPYERPSKRQSMASAVAAAPFPQPVQPPPPMRDRQVSEDWVTRTRSLSIGKDNTDHEMRLMPLVEMAAYGNQDENMIMDHDATMYFPQSPNRSPTALPPIPSAPAYPSFSSLSSHSLSSTLVPSSSSASSHHISPTPSHFFSPPAHDTHTSSAPHTPSLHDEAQAPDNGMHPPQTHDLSRPPLPPARKQRFTMGPRADCEKCRLGVPGHWMHFD